MRSGKGVWIPKFGHFTFTAINVDLSVSLNFLNYL
ncbi:MAG: HU domain-containing protein [bacterium]